jgi:DNA modification methylase
VSATVKSGSDEEGRVPYFSDESVTLWLGKCEDILSSLPGSSIDACVTDPPYGLSELPRRQVEAALSAWLAGDRLHVPDGRGFMGQEWDRFVPPPGVWDEVYRVLKPGAYLMAFAAPRTYDLMALSIRLAGFEIQDSIDWIFGQGWPKGRGRLKPAHEPLVLAWKPAPKATEFPGLDACRVNPGSPVPGGGGLLGGAASRHEGWRREAHLTGDPVAPHDDGRWPPNVVFSHAEGCVPLGLKRVRGITGGTGNHDGSVYTARRWNQGAPVRDYADADGLETVEEWDCAEGCPVAEIDRQSGVLVSGANPARRSSDKTRDTYGTFEGQAECTVHRGADSGGASRFFPVFRYEAKAPSSERPRLADGTAWSTVKPLGFMRWAVRLITPQGGTCLDPFAGTFTTAEACIVEGFPCIAIDRDEKALRLGLERLSKPIQPVMFGIEAG